MLLSMWASQGRGPACRDAEVKEKEETLSCATVISTLKTSSES